MNSPSTSECHFLRIPLEIRLKIYNHLIPSTNLSFCQKWWYWKKTPPQKSLSILRTNHQIYHEASTVLYNETAILLYASDIFCLPPVTKRDPLFSYNLSDKKIDLRATSWRHNPLVGIGKEVNSTHVYSQPLLKGTIEPHILAKFQNVIVNISLLLRGANTTRVILNEGPEVYEQTVLKEQQRLQKTILFKILIKILENTPILKTLTILMSVDGGVRRSEYGAEDDDSDSEPDADDDEHDKIEHLRKRRVLERDKAMDVLVQSGVLDPLRELGNVGRVEFRTPIGVEEQMEAFREVDRNTEEILGDLKREFEA